MCPCSAETKLTRMADHRYGSSLRSHFGSSPLGWGVDARLGERQCAVMDETFQAGRFKGQCFSDVAAREPGFVAWAKRQKPPTGQVKRFLEYLKAPRRGQGAIDAFVQRRPSEPAATPVASAPTPSSASA